MSTVTSRDGTATAFERMGSGPPLILVDSALCSRAFGPMPKLAPLLAEHFRVYLYDRRGRGDSADTKPCAKERAVEDLEALIGEAGGCAFVLGLSSGAGLALEAAASTLPCDAAIMGNFSLPAQRLGTVCTPTLVIGGGKSETRLRAAVAAAAKAIPNARLRTLPGQTHNVKPEALTPVVTEFFAA